MLGEGRPKAAKTAAMMGVVITMMFMLMNSSLFNIFRYQAGYLYSNDERVVAYAATLLPIASLTTVTDWINFLFFDILDVKKIFDGLQNILCGILRGAGKPTAGSIMNFVGYYLIAMPLYFGFGYGLELSVMGIWAGLTCGLFIICISLGTFICRINWEQESINARIRSEKQPIPSAEEEKVSQDFSEKIITEYELQTISENSKNEEE